MNYKLISNLDPYEITILTTEKFCSLRTKKSKKNKTNRIKGKITKFVTRSLDITCTVIKMMTFEIRVENIVT